LRIPKIFAHKQIHNPSSSLYSSPSLFYRTMQTILMGTISIILLFSNISGGISQILPLFSATTRSPISSASVKLCVTNIALSDFKRVKGMDQIASLPRSPVLILITSFTGHTNILPSPIIPVLFVSMIVSITCPTLSSGTTIVSILFGIYRIPFPLLSSGLILAGGKRCSPFCLPLPNTPSTVIEGKPTSASARDRKAS